MIIFTDLDGSLLNHEDYSFTEAMPSLDRIKQSGIPLIITTSKTRREVELLQREMGIREPVIVENGGGIFSPRGYRNLMMESKEQKDDYTVIEIGTTYSKVRDFLKKISLRFDIRGFGDMAPAEIAGLTGLTIERAALAKDREFTEPFIMGRPDEIDSLSELAAEEGLKVARGGRFHHLMGVAQDKGKAVRIVCDLFRQSSGIELTAIGLGDSENDLAMLEQVGIPVLIPRPGKGYLDIRLPGMIWAKEAGARGWNDVVLRLLDELRGITT
ncbi:MAG: mannosyl-3-phosphoglycerate phosphatase [Syntrophus sp. (in: bacteria)]|nr:mannosyl-3-phosphoglycerate phosphatase [Syntrophus sp. (in: bacteria)]